MPLITEQEIQDIFFVESSGLSMADVQDIFYEDWKRYLIEISAKELIKFAHAVIEKEKEKQESK